MDAYSVLNNISPYIRRAWDGNMMPGWRLKERVIFDYELVYIMEGKAEITIEDRNYAAVPGEVYFFRPGIRHSMSVAGTSPMRQPHIHFDLYYQQDSEQVDICYRPMEKIRPDEMKLFRVDINKPSGIVIPDRVDLKDREAAERLIFEIITGMEHSEKLAFLRVKGLFVQLLAGVLSDSLHEASTGPNSFGIHMERMNQIAEYIRINYRKSISVRQLAEIANISPSHLQRQFKLMYKTTPAQYQFHLKMEKARQMIGAAHQTLTEIAGYLGFSDIQHFSKAFRKYYGLPPSGYRKGNGI